MAVQKKFCQDGPGVVVKIQDHQGDLSKQWYVHWREAGKTQKKYGTINRIDNLEGRRDALHKLQVSWSIKLNKGVFAILYNHLERERIEKKWRKKTYQTLVSKVQVLEDWMRGRGVVTKNLIFEYFKEKRSEWHPVTFNRRLADLQTLFQGIGRADLFPEVKRIPKAKSQSKPARNYEKIDITTLKSAILEKDPKLWMAVQYMFNCAIRPGELRMLKRKNVYLDIQSIYIAPEVAKTGFPRYAEIPDSFLDLVSKHCEELRPSEYLFPSRFQEGKPVGKNYFTRKLRNIMDGLGYDEEYRPCYSWRNTSAIKGVEEDNIPLLEMKEAWGHRSIEQFVAYLRRIGARRKKIYAEKFSGI